MIDHSVGADGAPAVVSSLKDERVAPLRSLGSRAGRASGRRCLLEGRSLVEQAWCSGAVLDVVLCAESVCTDPVCTDPVCTDAEPDDLAGRLRAAGIAVHRVRVGVLRQVAGANRPVSWLAAAVLTPELTPELAPEAGPEAPWGEFAVVCDGVADPGNLGTLARSARALGVDDLVLTDPDTDPTSRRALDASRGAVLTLRTRRYPDPATAVDALHAAGFQVVATSPRGRELQALADLDTRPVALVVGGETDGVGTAVEQRADRLVRIPMAGAVESLNVGVAAGIGIYELRTKMVLSMIDERIRGTIGRDVAVADRFIRAALDRATRAAADLSGDQVVALMVVTAERETAAPELARNLGVGPDELGGLLEPLVARGWLEVTDSGDVAPGGYRATTAGEQAVAALWPVQQQVEHGLLDGLDAGERDTLRALLSRVQRNAMGLAAR